MDRDVKGRRFRMESFALRCPVHSLRPREARNRLAAAARRGDPPDVIDQARRDLAEVVLTDHIRAVRARVATWPLLTDKQIARLTLLLCGDEARNGRGT